MIVSILPLAYVVVSVMPDLPAIAMEVSADENAFVDSAILVHKAAYAILLAFHFSQAPRMTKEQICAAAQQEAMNRAQEDTEKLLHEKQELIDALEKEKEALSKHWGHHISSLKSERETALSEEEEKRFGTHPHRDKTDRREKENGGTSYARSKKKKKKKKNSRAIFHHHV